MRAAVRHGAYRYNLGCRCDDCRSAKLAARRETRARARAANSPAYRRELAATKIRKAGYRGVCERCGVTTDGSNGRAKAPRRCAGCAAAERHESRIWTRERILVTLAEFVRLHGRKPLSTEWRLKPYTEPYVFASVVAREFGSWNAMLTAAGLPTEAPGKYVRSAETRARMSAARRKSA